MPDLKPAAPEADGAGDLGKILLQSRAKGSLRDGPGGLVIGELDLLQDAVEAVGVDAEAVESSLVADPEEDQERAGHAGREPGDIEDRVDLVSAEAPEGDLEIVPEHGDSRLGDPDIIIIYDAARRRKVDAQALEPAVPPAPKEEGSGPTSLGPIPGRTARSAVRRGFGPARSQEIDFLPGPGYLPFHDRKDRS